MHRIIGLPVWCAALLMGLPLVAMAQADTRSDTLLTEAPVEPRSWLHNNPDRLGGHQLQLGGYAEAVVDDRRDAPVAFSLDRVSLLGSWTAPGRWSGLLELEVKRLLRLQPGNSGSDDARPVLERAHIDYAQSDALQWRIGKFLTPIGRWNQLHAAPLTWTTSRPLITEDTFPTNATGAMARGVTPIRGQALEWSIWASPGDALFPDAGEARFRRAYGLRLMQDLGPYLQLGVSLADYAERGDPDNKTLYSADLRFARNGFELSGEFAYRVLSRSTRRADEQGFYVQAVAPLAPRWFAVARFETFEAADAVDDLHFYLGGVTLRWSRQLVGKLEYRKATENGPGAPEGLLGSVAVLF